MVRRDSHYTFEANGVLKATVTDAAGNLLVTRTNMRGYKNQAVDADMGTWNYQYDTFDQFSRPSQTTVNSDAASLVSQR